MSSRDNYSEDLFADTRMTFGEHIEDLRVHLIRAILGFMIALAFSFFFLGSPMLRFISAPVNNQLKEFYANRAKRVLKDRDQDSELQEANRPKVVKMSFLRRQLEAVAKGETPPQSAEPLPDEVQPLPYGDLMFRVHLVANDAHQAAYGQKWEDLRQLAKELERLAQFLGQANKVPADHQDKWEEETNQLAKIAAEVAEAGRKEDTDRADRAMARLDEYLGDKDLVKLAVRIDEPISFMAIMQPALSQVTKRAALSTLSVQEALMAWFKVSVACGLVIGSPWIFYQIWLFIAAGLYPHEKRLVHVYLPVSLGLFLAGVLICQFLVIPKAIEALLWFNEWLGFDPDLRFNEWLGFAIMMPLVFGISFQLPLVMMFLERIGIFTVANYINKWRIACFAIHVFAALITPSIDFISMELLAIPMFGLYYLGILLCKLNPGRQPLDIDVPESGEMVEV